MIKPECLLSEAIVDAEVRPYSPLAECVMLVTIAGRALAHKQMSKMEVILGSATSQFFARHEWVHEMLTRRLNSLQTIHPNISHVSDPMVVFSYLVAQTAISTLR